MFTFVHVIGTILTFMQYMLYHFQIACEVSFPMGVGGIYSLIAL